LIPATSKIREEEVSMRYVTYGIISGSCPVTDFFFVSWSFTTRNSVLREMLGCETYGTVLWMCPVVDYFNFARFGELDLIEIGCENERWMELTQDLFRWLTLLLTVFILRFSYQKDEI
jgi:hypothetical protein